MSAAILAVFVPPAAAAPTIEPYRVLPATNASIHYRTAAGELAATVRDALELADAATAPRFGRPLQPIQVFIYGSTKEMIEGLMTRVGYDPPTAALIARVGVSPSSRGFLHLHAKTVRWGFLTWHAVIHEYVHGVVEDRYGAGIARRGRWLYEGVGEYEAYRALQSKFGDAEREWSRGRFKRVFRALVSGRRPALASLVREEDWIHNMTTDPELWDLQYAEAYAAITFLIDRHGFASIQQLLAAVGSGSSLDAAMEAVLDISLARFDRQFVLFMIEKGLVELYWGVTLAVGCLLGLVVLARFLLLRRAESIRSSR